MRSCTNCQILEEECENLRKQITVLSTQYETLVNIKQCNSVEQSTQTENHVSLSTETYSIQSDDVPTDECSSTVQHYDCTEDSAALPVITNDIHPPYEIHTEQPFKQFSVSDLDSHTSPHYQNIFPNRAVATCILW